MLTCFVLTKVHSKITLKLIVGRVMDAIFDDGFKISSGKSSEFQKVQKKSKSSGESEGKTKLRQWKYVLHENKGKVIGKMNVVMIYQLMMTVIRLLTLNTMKQK